jgi:hypothetical protein
MNLPAKRYTETDLARARQHGKIVGWLQAGAVVVGGSIILSLLGWLPAILTVGAVGWVGYKWMTRSKDSGAEEGVEELSPPSKN